MCIRDRRRTATFVDDEMKNGESHTVPLNDTALAAIRFQLGQHDELVFPRSDMEAIENIPSKMWQRVCKKANIKNFRWHDFRHTWASWLRQQGEGLDKIQELGGWKDPSMVQRYAHLDVKHLVQSASVIDGILNWNELNSSPQLVRKNLQMSTLNGYYTHNPRINTLLLVTPYLEPQCFWSARRDSNPRPTA